MTEIKKIYYYSTTKTDFLSYCNKIVGLVKIYVSKLLLILFYFSRHHNTYINFVINNQVVLSA